MTHSWHFLSFWLLRDTNVSEESVTRSAREVRCEQRWERKSEGGRPTVCLRVVGRIDRWIDRTKERGRGKTFSSGLSCGRESHLGKWPSAYWTHPHAQTHTYTLPQEAAKTGRALLHLSLPRKASLWGSGSCRKTLLLDLNTYFMNLRVCTCGPSVCFACRISVEFLPLNYTVYLLCVRKLLPTCQHAAARRKALIAVRYFVFQGFTKTWRHQTGCIKLCEG